MKAILALALVFFFGGVASAADPVGTWNCEYEIRGQKRTSVLVLSKDGDKLVGTMSWPDQPATNLADLKQQGTLLTFAAVRKFMGNEIHVKYSLTLDGDALKGKGTSEFGGTKQEWDITAKRAK